MTAVPPWAFSAVATVPIAVVAFRIVVFSNVSESDPAVNQGTGHDSVAFSGDVKPVP
jgi:hypothetical protein